MSDMPVERPVDVPVAGAILETAIYARDLEAAERFYRVVLGLTVVRRLPGAFVFLRCGQQMLLIFDPVASLAPGSGGGVPRHGATGPGHVCFRADGPGAIDRWIDRFAALGVPVEHVHVWPGGAQSVYVRDPAGNSVEFGEARMWGLDRAAAIGPHGASG